MTPTHGRMDAHSAILVWRFRPGLPAAATFIHRVPDMSWDWCALVPAEFDRPSFIPADALAFALKGAEDRAYVW